MLQLIRDHAKGVIAWIIVLLIVIPFALFGINQYFQGGADIVVAEVNDTPVHARDFQRLFQRERAMRRQLMGENFDPELMNDELIKKETIERIVNAQVVSQSAAGAGFRIGDARLAREIRSIGDFQRDGQFNRELYTRLLRSLGMSEGAFEEDMRRDLLTQQLMGAITDTALVTDHELETMLRLQQQQRKIGYLVLKAGDYLDQAEVSDAEIQRYYEANLDRFAVPERVKAAYIELSLAAIKREIAVDEQQLRRMYEERAASFTVEGQRRVRHILVEVEEGAEKEAVETARAEAENLLARIQAGESFAELARQHSDDGGSASEGGDLGFFGQGVMVKPFEDAVFEMGEGEVRGPVRSPFGFHIIKLEEVRPGSSRTFEEVRDQLIDEAKGTEAEKQFFEQAETLANLTFEHPRTLQPAAEELGLGVRSTEFFSRDRGPGIAADAKFRAAAFSEDVLEAGNNSEPVELGDARFVVVRVDDRLPETHRPLEEVRDAIARDLRREAAQAHVARLGEEVVERSEQGASLIDLAGEYNAEWNAPELVLRTASGLSPAVLDAAFSAGRPRGDDTPEITGTRLSSGDYAVVALYEVHDGDPGVVPEEQRLSRERALIRQIAQRISGQMLEGLKERMDIVVYEDKL